MGGSANDGIGGTGQRMKHIVADEGGTRVVDDGPHDVLHHFTVDSTCTKMKPSIDLLIELVGF